MHVRVWALCVLFGVAACGGNSSSPTSPAPSQPYAPFSTTDLVVGSGATAANGQRASVTYTGWLYDPAGTDGKGRQFDSNVGGTPLAFVLGAGQVIRGFDQGVLGMQVGGKRRIVMPPELAYGSAGAGGGAIPPNATLVFEVELLGVT